MKELNKLEYLAPLVGLLLVGNLILTAVTYVSIQSYDRLDQEIQTLTETVQRFESLDSLPEGNTEDAAPEYPLRRYSVIYNRTMSFLVLVVIANIIATIAAYYLILRKINPEKQQLSDIHKTMLTVKDMLVMLPEVDTAAQETLTQDIGRLIEQVDTRLAEYHAQPR